MSEVEKKWNADTERLERDGMKVANAKLGFSWLPQGLFERLACVIMRNSNVGTRYKQGSRFSPESLLFYVRSFSGLRFPVMLHCKELKYEIQISTLSGALVSARGIIRDVYDTVKNILENEMQLEGLIVDTILVGEEGNLFYIDDVESSVDNDDKYVDNIDDDSVKVELLGPWFREYKEKDVGNNDVTSLTSWKYKDTVGRLTPLEFEKKKQEWIEDWRRGQKNLDELVLELENSNLDSVALRKQISFVLRQAIDGPFQLIANTWRDALKHSSTSKNSLEEYKKVFSAFLTDLKYKPLDKVDEWISKICKKMSLVVNSEDRFGIFLSHQGIKADEDGNERSFMKINTSLVKKILCEKELRFEGDEPVPIFLDNDTLITGDDPIELMLFTAYATDHIIALIDNEYCSRKWCLMEYFIGKHGEGVLRPVLVDKPCLPFDIGSVYMEVSRDLDKVTEGKLLKALQTHFKSKDAAEYTHRK